MDERLAGPGHRVAHSLDDAHIGRRRARHVPAVQEVVLEGQTYEFDEGDALHTENSCKYTVAGFQALAARAGYVPAGVWCDPQGLFSLHWLSLPA